MDGMLVAKGKGDVACVDTRFGSGSVEICTLLHSTSYTCTAVNMYIIHVHASGVVESEAYRMESTTHAVA